MLSKKKYKNDFKQEFSLEKQGTQDEKRTCVRDKRMYIIKRQTVEIALLIYLFIFIENTSVRNDKRVSCSQVINVYVTNKVFVLPVGFKFSGIENVKPYTTHLKIEKRVN